MEVPWGGSLGMDAERAPLGHGWPVGACPPHGTGANVPPRSGGRTPAQRFWLLLAPKVTRPSGRNLTQQHPDAVVATRFQAQRFDSSKLQTYEEPTSWRGLAHRLTNKLAPTESISMFDNQWPMV